MTVFQYATLAMHLHQLGDQTSSSCAVSDHFTTCVSASS